MKRTRMDRYPEAFALFSAEVLRPDGKLAKCVVCGERPHDPHHVVPQQAIKRFCATLAVDPEPWLADGRNGLALCRGCHDAHEYQPEGRLPRDLVPESAWRFACDLDAQLGTEAATLAIERAHPE